MDLFAAFRSLRNRTFAQLYAAHAISLFGDALTWVGLALLAFELAGRNAAAVLAAALTLRVLAFVLLSPLAGALADRMERKTILVASDAARLLIVAMVPFVSEVWQVYLLIFLLNAFTAFFTPTFQATIPLVTGREEYPQAIALSGATYEVLGVLGPGIAGGVAALLGWQGIFWLDAGSFALSGMLILLLPGSLSVVGERRVAPETGEVHSTALADVLEGTTRLWGDRALRYALIMELVAAIAGAWQLSNTVVLVKDGLQLGDVAFGGTMAAFGIGATLAALALGALEHRIARLSMITIGAFVTSAAILPANALPLAPLIGLWFLAGAGQNWVNLPTQTLIADRIPAAAQGRVYGAHFAWSHLWWAGAYPLAGWIGSGFPDASFLWGGVIALLALGIAVVLLRPRRTPAGDHRTAAGLDALDHKP